MAKSPLGKLKPVAIGMMELPRLGASILEGYRALGDLSGTVSDAMDECGVAAVVPASMLRPTEPRAPRWPGAHRAQPQEPRKAQGLRPRRHRGAQRRAAEVLAIAQRLAASEAARLNKSNEGIALAEFVKLPR